MTATLDPTGSGTRAAWEKAAAAVLAKSGKQVEPDAVADALARRTADGIQVTALGTPETTAGLPDPGVPGTAPFLRGSAPGARDWAIRAAVAEPDPAQAAAVVLEELTGGASSIWLTVGDNGVTAASVPDVLAEMYVDLAPVIVRPTGSLSDLGAAQLLADLAASKGVRLFPTSNPGADPIGRAVRSGATSDLSEVADIAGVATDLGIRGFVVDGTVAHYAWAGDAAELGWSLAVGVEYLRALDAAGIAVDAALPLLEFRYAATDEQFPTIAKFRAARLLWDRVGELAGAGSDRPGQAQHAVTSWPMVTRYDPHTNLLRTTVAAFAAGVGGADAITVIPFDAGLGLPEALGRRMARNISHLLMGESHVTATADPGGGSHLIERLTWDMAEAAWAEFGRIEEAGGAITALADGSLAARWAQAAAERRERIERRKQPITGVSEFPQLAETLPERRFARGSTGPHWAEAYERLRDTRCATPVVLATLGPVAAHTARVTFALNAFAAGGVSTEQAGATGSVQDVLDAYAGQPVVCLTGSDKDYAAWGPELIGALRAAGVRRIVLAGRPSEDLAPLIDDHVAIGVNLIAFLDRTRTALSGEQEEN